MVVFKCLCLCVCVRPEGIKPHCFYVSGSLGTRAWHSQSKPLAWLIYWWRNWSQRRKYFTTIIDPVSGRGSPPSAWGKQKPCAPQSTASSRAWGVSLPVGGGGLPNEGRFPISWQVYKYLHASRRHWRLDSSLSFQQVATSRVYLKELFPLKHLDWSYYRSSQCKIIQGSLVLWSTK